MNTDSTLVRELIREGKSSSAVGMWLLGSALMVLAMISIGGYTRLSRSGLSMTRWKPVGYKYPRSTEDWNREFDMYKEFPEYQFNKEMTLNDFKRIFNIEYFHRLSGNLLGFIYGLPMAYFWSRGYFTKKMKIRTSIFLVLGAIQGGLGWWMVKSGLQPKPDYQSRPRVSTYRLVVHNTAAITIYSLLFYHGLSLIKSIKPVYPDTGVRKKVFRAGVLLAHLVFANILSGAMSAGVGAGHVYNTWPLMNGNILPANYWKPGLGWRNLFENLGCVQFNHRVLAYATYIATTLVFLRLRKLKLPPKARFGVYALYAAVNWQVVLGIYMILHSVKLDTGVYHQASGILVLSLVIYLLVMGRA